jgi:chemotaxis-related protein WspD
MSEPTSDSGLAGSGENGAKARRFFDRLPPEGYLREWTERMARPDEVVEPDLVTLLVFRVGGEWLAIGSEHLVEVTHAQPVHTVPFRTGRTLRGLVNVRGQLRLCFSLHALLSEEGGAGPRGGTSRMVIIQEGTEQWVFLADEVARVNRVPRTRLRKPPSTLPGGSSFTTAVFDWNGKTVGFLDGGRLMGALRSLMS